MTKNDQNLEKIPFSEQLEQQVLGCLLLAPHCWDDIADLLSEEVFYILKHKIIFQSIIEQLTRSLPVDVISITEVLKKKNQHTEVGGEIYLFELMHYTVTAANAKYYAEMLRSMHQDRKMLKITHEIIESINNKEENRLDLAQQKFASLSEDGTTEIVFAREVLPDVISKIDDRRNNPGTLIGLSSGFIDLDKMTYGLQRGDLIILGARPSMGKTLLALNIAEHATFSLEKTVAIFSLEMKKDKLIERIISSLSRTELEKIKTGHLTQQEFDKIGNILPRFNDAKLIIDDRSSVSVEQIRAKC